MAVLTCPIAAWGHASNESYVWVNVRDGGIEGRFEVRFVDLRRYLGVAVPDDLQQARAMLPEHAERLQTYFRERFEIRAEGDLLPIRFTGLDVYEAEGGLGGFARFNYVVEDTVVPDTLLIRNTILLDARDHRSLVCMEYNEKTGEEFGGEFTALVFSPQRTEQVLDLSDIQGLPRPPEFVGKGAWAMIGGLGHLAFVLALIVPTVLVWRGGAAEAAPSLRGAVGKLIAFGAAFSLGYGLTLGLAGLGLVRAPLMQVQIAVLVSTLLLAANNTWRPFGEGVVLVIFALGLFHGFALQAELERLPFRIIEAKKVLLGFTAGAALGQGLLMVGLFPVAFLATRKGFHVPAMLCGSSLVAVLLSGTWFVNWMIER